AGAVAGSAHTGCVKCTWLFQKPAVTVPPAQSITVAPGGTRTSARAPTAVIVAPSTRTTPSGITAASGDGCTRPPTSAVTGVPDAAEGAGVVPQAAARSARAARSATRRVVISGSRR